MHVGVTQNQHRVRFLGVQHMFGADQSLPEHSSERRGVHPESVIGRPDPQIPEEDAVQQVVVVLAGVHQDVWVTASSAGMTRDNRISSGGSRRPSSPSVSQHGPVTGEQPAGGVPVVALCSRSSRALGTRRGPGPPERCPVLRSRTRRWSRASCELVLAHLGYVVPPHGGHVDHDRLSAVDVERCDLAVEEPPDPNPCATRDDHESLDFVQAVMLTSRHTGRVEERNVCPGLRAI